jgi:uncharacterized protein YbjQ (UPF0145 family)
MTNRLEVAESALAARRYGAAADALWDAFVLAQDMDNLALLSAVEVLAQRVTVEGDPAAGATAARILSGIRVGRGEVASSDVAGSARPPLPVTTGNDLPGYRIDEVIGPVFGMTVRSRDVISQWGAKLRGGTVGGELRAMTEALEQSRAQVVEQMEDRARRIGADGVIAFRFDLSEMAGMWTQICAYGTAVRATRDEGER